MEPIGTISSCFRDNFSIPRQSGLVPACRGEIHFISKYHDPDYFRGLEQYSHLWVIFQFHQLKGHQNSPMARVPRLGGNKKWGIFASRTPYHPNQLGLSLVKLEELYFKGAKAVLTISGHDLLDGTPVYDIKPYLPYADQRDALWPQEQLECSRLEVVFDFSENIDITDQQRETIVQILQHDPRPAYQNDQRLYHSCLDDLEYSWQVVGQKVTVKKIRQLS